MLQQPEPLVTIIIVNYNGASIIRDCLDSLSLTSYPNYEVIVVDNCSIDDSCSLIEREFSYVKLIKLPENKGYSIGNNKGILCAKGEFIVLLNNDTIVCPSWLSELMREAVKNPDCFYQPKILFLDSGNSPVINSVGNSINLFAFAFPLGICQSDRGQFDDNYKIAYASGVCILVSKHLIQRVGLLDEEEFFSFYEDVNWGWRALMLGYTSMYVSSSVIYHKWGGSWGRGMTRKKFFCLEQGRLTTFFRNYSSRTIVAFCPFLFLVELSSIGYSLINGYGGTKIAVYANMLKNRSFILHQRMTLQKKRLYPDKEIVERFSYDIIHPYFGKLSYVVKSMMYLISNLAKRLIK